ncbi:PREDICTED: pseudo histidine-containing phosphotransfer protein 2 [Theobroma cacao]|uniref:Histidine-containing phosphotransfer protein n=1 Tax=Theobroma cacao TaxID=3641 RepID=A0AB32WR50_THECC|nr:PREDICTED: pseudo histidine-containing phosphotransfer protein 2 [Theobroma cacao]
MDSRSLREQIAVMRQSFFDEEILDAQFSQLEELTDKDEPNFVEDVVTMYFRESTDNLIPTIEEHMKSIPIDIPKLDRVMHKLKGSSASIGANKVRNEINNTMALLEERNVEGAKAAFEQVRKEHETLKAKLETYFQVYLSRPTLTILHMFLAYFD